VCVKYNLNQNYKLFYMLWFNPLKPALV
jgi:hypothetical protein